LADTKIFKEIFQELKIIMHCYEKKLVCTDNEDNIYALYTKHMMKNKKPLYFGSVQINKAYVSYHLMPIYVFSELVDTLTPQLKKGMQGKSCFNFKLIDKELFKEIDLITAVGFEKYQEAGYV